MDRLLWNWQIISTSRQKSWENDKILIYRFQNSHVIDWWKKKRKKKKKFVDERNRMISHYESGAGSHFS